MLFLLDENLPRRLAEVLRDQGHDVVAVSDSPLRGSADLFIWQEAAQQGRILITRDLDFPLPAVRPMPPGLVLIRAPDTYTADDLARLLLDLLNDRDLQELLGRITVVTPGRVRSRPLP